MEKSIASLFFFGVSGYNPIQRASSRAYPTNDSKV